MNRASGSLARTMLLGLLLAMPPIVNAGDAALGTVVDFDIPAQPLVDALIELTRQCGTQIVVNAERVAGRSAPAVRGEMSIGAALAKLLDGTGLQARAKDPSTIAIVAREPDDLPGAVDAPVADPPHPSEPETRRETPARSASVEEIIVTANRRAENVQDVAYGIRVFDGEELEKAGVAGFEDYVFKIPGADLGDSGMEKKVSIRGIGNIASNPAGGGGSASPIGIYLNDTPIQGNGVLPDLALYDLERIEVLKGPQGTLYGEGAQGGAIKMLLNKAVPGELLAKGELSLGHTRFGGGLNHAQNAAINAPLFGSWAFRLVGSRRENQGFVDFPERGTRDENDATNLMGRVHLDGELWDGFSLSGMLLHQRQRLDQFAQVQKSEGDLRNRNSEPQFADTDFTLAGLTLDYDLGFAGLTSSTSWFRNDRRMLSRFPFVGSLVFIALNPVLGTGVEQLPGADNEWIASDNEQSSIAQELRLVSSPGSWIDWVAGGFYRTRENEFDFVEDNDLPCCPPPVQTGVIRAFGVESFEQLAGFGELTLDLPWNLELGAGVRVFRETAELDGQGEARGPLYAVAVANGNPDGKIAPRRFETATTEVTPKASLSWFVDEARMLYVLVANGVRSGGTNLNAIPAMVTPLFSPDSLWTYEVGAKTQWLDGRLTANCSLFYNDWRDLQVLTTEEGSTRGAVGVPLALSVILNVGRAFSRGAELELLALPIEGLTLDMNLSVLDGEISEGDPAGIVADGTALPQLSELSYAASARYELLDWSLLGLTPFVGFDTQRVGDRLFSPPSTLPGPELEGFHLYGAMVGVANERWDLSFDVRNLTDARPELGGNLLELETKTIGSPRTWTVRVAFNF